MKNLFILLGFTLIIVACDRSIESRLKNSTSEHHIQLDKATEQSHSIADNLPNTALDASLNVSNSSLEVKENTDEKNIEAKKAQEENRQEKNELDKSLEQNKIVNEAVTSSEKNLSQPAENKPVSVENKIVNAEIKEEPKEVSVSEGTDKAVKKAENDAKKPQKNLSKKEDNTKLLSAKDVVNSVKISAPKYTANTEESVKVAPLEKQTKLSERGNNNKPEAEVKKAATKQTRSESNKSTESKVSSKQTESLAKVKNPSAVKVAENDGTYENGQLVSTFTEEELRVGAQKSLTKDEIQYYKSLCRYAYMSEQDVIENRCESKKVLR